MSGHVVGNSFKWPVESRREKEASCKCIYTHVRLCPRTFMMYTHSLERIENSILQNTHTALHVLLSLYGSGRARVYVCVCLCFSLRLRAYRCRWHSFICMPPFS